MTKFLIVGAGSIGLRHIRCLIGLGYDSIAALRTKKGTNKELPDDIKQNVVELFSWEEVYNWKPTHMIVANPTSLHLDTVLKGIQSNYNILVEKPFVDNYESVENNILKEKLDNYEKGKVAYNLRFNSVFQFLKKSIDSGLYGEVIRAELQVGHYLPFWHKNEDYRESYAAQKQLGGGVLRTLSHEIDLCQYLFGKYRKITSNVAKVSDLEIDVDDTVDIFLKCDACSNIFVHLDYLNPTPTREGRIFTTEGLIKYNYFGKKVTFTSYESLKEEVVYASTDDYDSQYENQLIDFIKEGNIGSGFNEGLMVDRIIEICEKSSKENISICLD